MKILNSEAPNFYTCQFCKRVFKTDQICAIENSIYPVCSKLCFFRQIYQIISKYDLDTIKSVLSLYFPIIEDKNEPFNQRKAIYRITQKFVNDYYTSLNNMGHGTGTSIMRQEGLSPNLGTNYGTSCAIYIAHVPCPQMTPKPLVSIKEVPYD